MASGYPMYTGGHSGFRTERKGGQIIHHNNYLLIFSYLAAPLTFVIFAKKWLFVYYSHFPEQSYCITNRPPIGYCLTNASFWLVPCCSGRGRATWAAAAARGRAFATSRSSATSSGTTSTHFSTLFLSISNYDCFTIINRPCEFACVVSQK